MTSHPRMAYGLGWPCFSHMCSMWAWYGQSTTPCPRSPSATWGRIRGETFTCKIQGSHSSDYEDCHLLHDAMWSGRILVMFQKNLLPQYSRQKNSNSAMKMEAEGLNPGQTMWVVVDEVGWVFLWVLWWYSPVSIVPKMLHALISFMYLLFQA